MTHDKDTERAEFEKAWRERPIYMGGDHQKEVAYIWWMQAARRAPAAPVPQGWKLVPISPTQEQLRAGYWSGGGEIRLHEEWARKESYERMVHKAPQPPEAVQSISAEFDGIKKVAAPVELPEPGLYSFEEHIAPFVGDERKMARTTYTKFKPQAAHTRWYNEQQVRDLLAAHGIGKDKA